MSYEAVTKLKSILCDDLKRDERKSRSEAVVSAETIIGTSISVMLHYVSSILVL